LLLGLLLVLRGVWLGLIQARGFAMRSVQINASWGWWNLALCLKEARLEIDNIVA
jgi:hypothetical protein